MTLIYTPAGISVICGGFWYLPWIIDPHAALGYYLLSFFWFLGAWVVLLGLVALGFREKRKQKSGSPHYFYSALAITVSYLAVFMGAGNGYMVTV